MTTTYRHRVIVRLNASCLCQVWAATGKGRDNDIASVNSTRGCEYECELET